MKKILSVLFLFVGYTVNGQQFVSSGLIEYEVKVNVHKQLGDNVWAEQIKNQVPQFSTSWYHLTFTDKHSLYKLNRKDEKSKIPFQNSYADEDTWYNNYQEETSVKRKFVFDDMYLLNDSLMDIEWQLSPNETRVIAGFNCRKAQAIIFDSVYVFAFYTDEIVTSGGPMGLHGLPGMILGVTIPRMYTSWIATRLQVADVNTGVIQAPNKGKKKDVKALQKNIEEATKDWGNWGQQSIWNIFL